MTSKQFIAAFLAGAAGIAAVVVPFNMYVDVYGIFRPAHGRRLPLYGEERLAKYLHTFRYIPENFDGVLLGSSVSDNLETDRLGGYRIYNASINGGNVEDVKPLAENLFRRGELRVDRVVHPSLPDAGSREEDRPDEPAAILGRAGISATDRRICLRAGDSQRFSAAGL